MRGSIVDAPYYGADSDANLYTYPAVVVDGVSREGTVRLHYLSDGLSADTDEEAFGEGDGVVCVPAHVV